MLTFFFKWLRNESRRAIHDGIADAVEELAGDGEAVSPRLAALAAKLTPPECETHPLVRDGNKWWRIYPAGETGMVAEIGRTADAKPGDIAEDAANARIIAAAPDLLAELEQTADWLEQRAEVLGGIAAMAGVSRHRAPQIRDEAARLQGRAAVIRQTILKATQGA